MTEQMIKLDSLIRTLEKQLAARPKDGVLQAQLDAAQAEYDQISSALGGDRAPVVGEPVPPSQPVSPGGVIAPPAPPGCTEATQTFTNSTPVAIIDNMVVTSTISVAGVGPYLWDLNLQTFITHTFAADLDITITSPSGKVVTLTTDNGGANDNVFNGTVWDDDADPDTQVPYTNNQNLVAEHTYSNLTVVPTLVPEEALGAFVGDDPNGTWTLRVSDDAGGDIGSLNSWSLEITTLAAAPTTATASFTNSTPVAIVDNMVVTSTINVAGAGTSISDVNLTTFITHTFAADLDITITSPAGTVVTLTTDNGGANDNVFNGTVWDDDADPNTQVPYTSNPFIPYEHTYTNLVTATPLLPEEALAAFTGENPNGTWTLSVSDDATGDTGTLNSWSLNIVTSLCGAACTITCPANITVSNDPNQCGAVVNYPAPTPNGTCGTINCSPASGSFFPVGTTTVTCTSSAGPTCTFTVTVNDTQPPTITCPANVTAVTDQNACPAPACQTVNFPAPVATDNCPGVVVVCTPPAGGCFPTGTTTVTCTATDASGNTATCSFTITTFDVALQDDSDPSIILLWNSLTGAYRFCCNGITFTGVGKSTIQGCVFTLQHNPADRRVLGRVDKAVHAGTASIQFPAGTTRCTITDRNTLDDTLLPACQ
jgi:subtilisin-like proprotein convertase family protein